MTSRPRVTVVGLGPAGAELVDGATLAAIERTPTRFVRTRRHPAADLLDDAISFDRVYEEAASLPHVYDAIVEELVMAATRDGAVLYAVPGSPFVAERTVQLLYADERVDVVVHPALSFLDLAWSRLRVDPLAVGVRLVDGRRFTIEAAGERGPLLVAQCDSVSVLSDIKLALDASRHGAMRPDAMITVLQRLGSPDESVEAVRWSELDRAIEPDPRTSLWIDQLAVPIAREVERFAELVATLRRECPWDREQTHESLMRHLLEETYELLDAIESVDTEAGTGYDHLEEELGDVLFQVVFHAALATEAGQFTLADVADSIHDKLYSRHPHVFGDTAVSGADDVVRNWEQLKKAEKGRASVFDGIPTQLPALLLALKVQKKAGSLAESGAVPPLAPEPIDLTTVVTSDPDPAALGELLFGVVDLARRHGIDPETALRSHALRFRDSVQAVERAE